LLSPKKKESEEYLGCCGVVRKMGRRGGVVSYMRMAGAWLELKRGAQEGAVESVMMRSR